MLLFVNIMEDKMKTSIWKHDLDHYYYIIHYFNDFDNKKNITLSLMNKHVLAHGPNNVFQINVFNMDFMPHFFKVYNQIKLEILSKPSSFEL